jgi:hypothetical protein
MIGEAEMRKLRAPFTVAAVKFRPLEKPNAKGVVSCLVYIDSRLAAERLSAVDPGWSSEYEVLAGPDQHMPVVCKLTVHGVTREGVGQNAGPAKDDKHAKMAFSDALKRAAVEFGVGASLYAMPRFAVDAQGYWIGNNQKVGGLTPLGVRGLRAQYQKAITEQGFVDRFGEPIDHGDYLLPDEDAAGTVPILIDPREVAILCAIGHALNPQAAIERLQERYSTVTADAFNETLTAGLTAAVEQGVVTRDHADGIFDAITSGASVAEVRSALTPEQTAGAAA